MPTPDKVFTESFLPEHEQATITYKGWRKRYATTEVPKWDAYLPKVLAHKKGDPRPAVPALGTHFGKALLAAAEQHLSVIDLGAVWTPPDVEPPPPSSTYQNERMLVRQSAETDVATLGNFGVVELSSYLYSICTQIKASFPNCKVLFYKTASDCRDEGTGSAIPSLAQRLQGRTTITYNEILNHDAANPGDKWLLTSNGSTALTPWYSFAQTYGGNIGKTSFRQKWVERVQEKLTQQPLWDGVFVDNVSVMQPNGWPAEYPSQATWTAAMKGLIDYAGPIIQAQGKIFSANAVYFISGDASSDTGAGTTGWWQQIGPSCDILFNEYPLQNPNNTAVVKLQGSGFPYSWDGWMNLVKVCQDMGMHGVLNANLGSQQGANVNSSQTRYVRASSMLDWNGSGPCFSIDYAGSLPWSGPVALNLGQPLGARSSSNGIHMRQFQLGWVAVNPTSSSRTAVVGSTSRTIPSGDAYLGPS
jgi:hypothetical protein